MNGAILVYDITNTSSFENIEKHLIQLRMYSEIEDEILIIGNKKDQLYKCKIECKEGNFYSKKNDLLFKEISAYKENSEDLIEILYPLIQSKLP